MPPPPPPPPPPHPGYARPEECGAQAHPGYARPEECGAQAHPGHARPCTPHSSGQSEGLDAEDECENLALMP
jgi:hypothetical protein